MNQEELEDAPELRKAKAATLSIQIGVGLFAFSFLVGYPISLAAFAFGGIKIGLFCYIASWIPFILGFLIGGRPAYRTVKLYRLRWRRKLAHRAPDE